MRNVRLSFIVAGLACGLSVSVGTLMGGSKGPPIPADAPAAPPAPMPAMATAGSVQPVAYVYGNVPVTNEEFGKFLMDRGGAEKLELFVNKRIIEMEAARRNLTVTKLEMEQALNDDLAGLNNVPKSDFIKVVLPKYNKTYFEWMEDVIRPRLLLTKMCKERVKVSEENLKIEFERRYGEMRQCQMLMWPKGDAKFVTERFDKARRSQEDFDREAIAMANPALAAVKGYMKPISRHLIAEDKQIENAAFALKEGEISHVMETTQGYIVLKLHTIIKPNSEVSFEKERPLLEKAAYEEQLAKEIPIFFAELKKAANPTFHYASPSDWRTTGGTFMDNVPSIIRPAGATQPAPQPNAPVNQTPVGLPPAQK
jgi:hypothetical protein